MVHHIADGHCAGKTALLDKLLAEDLPQHCEITSGPLEAEGVSVEVLDKTKTHLPGAILTAPDPKHATNIIAALEIGPKEKSQVPSRKVNLENLEPLSAGKAAQYRSAVGSAIYLSAGRRDIQFAVKELARHMSAPRACDWECAQNMGRYLQTYPDLVRVTTLDPAAYEGPLVVDVFSDSDWGGCAEARRSTDSHVVVLGGAVVTATTQTQPGLPATSSPDAELRGISRACREALFVYELATKDFGLEVQIPRLWSDSSTGVTAAKRIGPGSKLRHLEVCEFYVQGAVQAGKVLLRKVKGTENPANFLTKHAKTGREVQEALPSLGMVDLKTVAGATDLQKHSVKTMRINPPTQWKPLLPFRPKLCLIGVTTAQQILGVKAQDQEDEDEILDLILNGVILLGLLSGLFLTLGTLRGIARCCLRRCSRATEAPEPEGEPEEEEEFLPQELQEPQVQQEDEIPEAENPTEDEEEQVAPAEAPAPQVRAPPLRDHRPPAPEPEPADQEPVPQQAAAAAAAPPVPPQGGMRRRNRGARQIPWRDQGVMYFAPTRRTAHIFRDCSGLASVPDAEIRTVRICQYCQANWPAEVPMTRELRHMWVQYDGPRTPHLLEHCLAVQYDATTDLPVCRHCRDGHIQRDP